jgi:hypothetical protein
MLDIERCELRRGLEPVALEPQVLDLLELDRPRENLVSLTLATLAAFDPQRHALGVDIADLERDHLGDAQPGAVRRAECRLYFGPGAAWSSSVTSSTLSTTGSRRGWRTTVSRRARSGRSSITVNKKRRAETALLMLGGCMPLCV